jgi:hypothetical protein
VGEIREGANSVFAVDLKLADTASSMSRGEQRRIWDGVGHPGSLELLFDRFFCKSYCFSLRRRGRIWVRKGSKSPVKKTPPEILLSGGACGLKGYYLVLIIGYCWLFSRL